MIILGIDPGIASTGWGIVKKNSDEHLLAYGCIHTSAKSSGEERLASIFAGIRDLIKKYKPEVLCLEKVFFNTNAKTVLIVGEARGVAKTCAFLDHLELSEFTPLQIKEAITGYGRADKKQIQSMIKTLLKLEKIPEPDDAADAIAAALTYCVSNKSLY